MAVKYIANILGTAVFATVLLIVAVPLKNSAKYFGEQNFTENAKSVARSDCGERNEQQLLL